MKKAIVIFKPGFSTDVVIFFCGFLWHHFCVFGFLYFGCNMPKFSGGVLFWLFFYFYYLYYFLFLGLLESVVWCWSLSLKHAWSFFASALSHDICVTGVLLGWSFWDIRSISLATGLCLPYAGLSSPRHIRYFRLLCLLHLCLFNIWLVLFKSVLF